MPSLTATDLTKRFGDVTALDGVTLDVTSPGVVGVVGPNGSGKTTLIRCLLGLTAPTTGSAQVDGTDAVDLSPETRAQIGYMPQRDAVYDDLTVRENVGFFARLYGVEDRADAVDRALDFVDLGDRADARIDELSGGMVRRTSLACALVHEPAVVVLDEPTVGIDPELRAEMWGAFRDRRDDGALVVVSTHYLGEAAKCDRVLFLRNGRVLAFDTPAAVRDVTGETDFEDAFLRLLDMEVDA